MRIDYILCGMLCVAVCGGSLGMKNLLIGNAWWLSDLCFPDHAACNPLRTSKVGTLAIALLVACSKSPPPTSSKPDDPSCAIEALTCSKYSSQEKTGMALQKLVYEARLAGRNAEAICLASGLLTSGDPWLSGASHYERSNAWEALGCHSHAVAEVEASLAVRPHGRSGWKETCDLCAQLKAGCAPCPGVASRDEAVKGGDEWSVLPSDYRPQSVEVVKFGSEFETLDEHDLGAVFTADLKRLRGTPSLFEDRPPKTVTINKIEKRLLRTWDKSSIDAGITFLFVGFGVSQTTEEDLVVYHSRDVREVVAINEDARVRHIDDEAAVFYLAEVRRGTCVDYIIRGDYLETGKKLDLVFKASLSLKDISAQGNYDLDLKAIGVVDATRDGAWAQSIDDIRRSYRTEPAVIELVFRTIPGRVYHPKPSNAPTPVIDEPSLKIGGGDEKNYSLPAGHYLISSRSRGGGHDIRWRETDGVRCVRQPGGNSYIKMDCHLETSAQLVLVNLRHPDLILDDNITASLYVGKLR